MSISPGMNDYGHKFRAFTTIIYFFVLKYVTEVDMLMVVFAKNPRNRTAIIQVHRLHTDSP